MRKLSRKSISILAAAAAVAAAGSGTAFALHKTVSVNVDGQSKEMAGFFTGSVKQFLQKNGIAVSDRDLVLPGLDSSIAEGMNIVVKHARKVVLQEGKNPPKELVTTAGTVADLLKQAGIELGDNDRVSAELKSAPADGQTITITRREIKVAVTEEKVPFQTERQPSEEIYKGQEKVLTPGVEGLAKVTTTTVSEDGVEIDRQEKKEIVKEPVTNVVAYGTKPMVIASRSGESFTSSSKYVMSATAYVGGGRTATGRTAEYGVAAVDPSVIPLGTKLYIEGYGYAMAADTGGAIKGMKIDLVFNSQSEALAFGRRQVVVHIVE